MSAPIFNYQELAPRVRTVLKSALGEDSFVHTEEGYLGRVHAKVVSELLNGKSERQKQAFLWDILKAEMDAEAQAVSLVVGYGTDEL